MHGVFFCWYRAVNMAHIRQSQFVTGMQQVVAEYVVQLCLAALIVVPRLQKQLRVWER